MDSGELCVMMGLVKMKLTLFADSWDTTVHTNMIIPCEYRNVVTMISLYFIL